MAENPEIGSIDLGAPFSCGMGLHDKHYYQDYLVGVVHNAPTRGGEPNIVWGHARSLHQGIHVALAILHRISPQSRVLGIKPKVGLCLDEYPAVASTPKIVIVAASLKCTSSCFFA
jgi:hypothetical protein